MNSDLPQILLKSLQSLLPEKGASLHEPIFRGNESKYVTDCIDTRWVSSVGSYVDGFERALADYTGAAAAVIVSNGTVALQVALEVAGVQRDDEVLLPALSFVATANATVHAGGIPHFVESETSTLGIDPLLLEDYLKQTAVQRDGATWNRKTGKRISALVPMHTLGHPCQIEALQEVAERCQLILIEDAAESLGSFRRGRHTGMFGKAGVLSFNGNKIITSGGGGAILSNDKDFLKRVKHLTTTAKIAHPWEYEHDEIAYNFRLPNLNAALGLAQLERVDQFLTEKRNLAQRYFEGLRDIPGVTVIEEPSECRSNYWLNAIRIHGAKLQDRNTVLALLHENGIKARPFWKLLNQLPMYKRHPSMQTPVAEMLEHEVICLPSSSFL